MPPHQQSSHEAELHWSVESTNTLSCRKRKLPSRVSPETSAIRRPKHGKTTEKRDSWTVITPQLAEILLLLLLLLLLTKQWLQWRLTFSNVTGALYTVSSVQTLVNKSVKCGIKEKSLRCWRNVSRQKWTLCHKLATVVDWTCFQHLIACRYDV